MPVRGNTFKIFIGNLSDRTTSDDLRQLFEVHGTVVEADAVKNFGFVHMQSEEDRKAAIEALNGFSLHGKAIVVESSTGAKKGNKQYTKIFVGNVPKDAKIEEIRVLFETYGRVVEADLLTNYAFIHMDCEENSKDAIRNLDGYELNGVRLRVQESTSRVRQAAGMGNPDLCYRCGSAGHWSKECPRDNRYGGGGGYGRGGPGRMGDRGDRMGRGGRGGGRMMERVDRMPRGGYGAPRYDPYPPPPPSFGRERMMRYREEYDPFDRYDRCYMRSTLYERSYDRMPQPPPMPEEMYDRRAILPPRGPDYINYGRRSPPPRYPPPPPAMGSIGGYGPLRGGPDGRPF